MKLRKNEERDQKATLNSCSRMCRATLEIKGRRDVIKNWAILENDG